MIRLPSSWNLLLAADCVSKMKSPVFQNRNWTALQFSLVLMKMLFKIGLILSTSSSFSTSLNQGLKGRAEQGMWLWDSTVTIAFTNLTISTSSFYLTQRDWDRHHVVGIDAHCTAYSSKVRKGSRAAMYKGKASDALPNNASRWYGVPVLNPSASGLCQALPEAVASAELTKKTTKGLLNPLPSFASQPH